LPQPVKNPIVADTPVTPKEIGILGNTVPTEAVADIPVGVMT